MSTNRTLFTLAFILFTYRLKFGASVLIRAARARTPETIGLFVRITAILLITGNPRFITGFNSLARGLSTLIQENSVIAASITQEGFHNLLLMLTGVLLAGFDINCLVALILEQSHLMPVDDQTGARAMGEAGRGRIIGILERSIVFVLIVRGNISAVGLILVQRLKPDSRISKSAISQNTS